MSDLATALASFQSKVERYAEGQGSRFALVLDELIEWSGKNNLDYTPHVGIHEVVKFSAGGAKMAFWTVTPRVVDGAKFTLLGDPQFPEKLRTKAREELAIIDGKKAPMVGVPEVAFTKLIWEPYRERVLNLMDRLLAELNLPAPV
jgi:hypothetical protein